MEIKNRVAVITGGQSGLGFASAIQLLQQGAKVAVFDAANEINAGFAGFDARVVQHFNVDVCSEKSVQSAIEKVMNVFGKIHICINCAGVAPAHKIIDRDNNAVPLREYERVIQINLIGTFNVCRLVAEKMACNKLSQDGEERGVIINTASIAAYDGQKGQCAYAASKGGIASMTLPMARDLSASSIRVMTIASGIMATSLMLAMPDDVQEQLSRSIPFPRRMGKPQEFAQLAEHIIENAYLNGETIRLDGSLRMV
ncbi:MAG: 3-hydroxyacyl-CoA dehydrogenase/3-hydroxy-2-methylbutyryl-CoA dehydrogenase [Lentisphaeria bacterium]|jgi:3-hydroxyacyl-CoA dehydrogenase/3-hydroxy-2-methylbutyryl-CoA dehydrogenase